ncbi:MAG: hypothetical protein KA249_08190 [Dermatophilaceae bacterium]|nr:hypothetical protein [Dermatophilaceae bacterium]
MTRRATSKISVLVLSLVLAACATPPVDPADGLPVRVEFMHGQGSQDVLSVDADGVLTGLLGEQDGNDPVGCMLDAAFLRDLGGAAVVDLEPGATEPAQEGADFERMEVIGARGSAWLGDGSEAARLALLLVGEVHLPAGERTVCRETSQTAPGDATAGVVLRRWGTQPLQGAAAFVSDTGVVTGSTGQSLSSCQVPATTVEVLTTSPVPDAPSQGNGNGNAGHGAPELGGPPPAADRHRPLEHDGSRVARRHVTAPGRAPALHATQLTRAESLS